MNLESQVTSLEMSKNLYEIGFRGGVKIGERMSIFWWQEVLQATFGSSEPTTLYVLECDPKDVDGRDIPAYTFQQLWEVLPDLITINSEIGFKQLVHGDEIQYETQGRSHKVKIKEFCTYVLGDEGRKIGFADNKTGVVDTVAEAVLWCIENKYLNTNNK